MLMSFLKKGFTLISKACKGFTLISKACQGFTLIELLVAMSILAILSTIAMASFRSTQMRGRDVQRKSDLKQISNALEMYYNDKKMYPGSNVAGQILGCPSAPVAAACVWGAEGTTSEFKDANTTYFKKLPKDPSAFNYFYHTLNSNKSYQIYAYLENTEDKNLIPGITILCGDENCNFAVFSSDVTATDGD